MQGDLTMMLLVTLAALCSYVDASGFGHVAPAGAAPIVTSASSQYFERTFNRLVAAPPQAVVPAPPPPPQVIFPAPAPPPQVVLPAPPQIFIPAQAPPQIVLPAQPPPILAAPPQFISVQPQQPHFTPQHAVFVSPVPNNAPAPVNPPKPSQPTPDATQQPNIVTAIATAHAAAPVATFLLPPYPFGFPPGFGYIQPDQTVSTTKSNPNETTTPVPTTRLTEATTTEKEPETTPVSSNSDNNFVQALPSNDNINFKQYGLPLLPQKPEFQGCNRCNGVLPQRQPIPQGKATGQSSNTKQVRPWPQQPIQPQSHPHIHYHIKAKPQKLKTSVEVVPIPLAYIAPPYPTTQQPHHHIKIIKHIYGFAPEPSPNAIVREIPTALRIRQVKRPVHFHGHNLARNFLPQNVKPNRNAEPITLRPLSKGYAK